MAFTSKNLVVGGTEIPTTLPTQDELTLQELEFILLTLKNTNLKGFQIELFYNLVVKIQNQYLKKANQNK
jgi:hypothetical protein